MFAKVKQLAWQAIQFYKQFDKDPKRRLQQLRFVLNKALSIVGIGFLYKNWKFNVLTLIKLIITITFVVFCFYTIWYFMDQSLMILQVFCCQGVFLPNTIKLHVILRRRRELCSFADFGEFLYHSNEGSSLEMIESTNANHRKNQMKMSIGRTYLTLLVIILAVCLAANIFSFFPAYMWLIKKNYVWLLPILVPFTNLEHIKEFYLNIVFQMIFSSSALISATCMDLFFALCICHHGTASKLIEQSLSELNTMWKNDTHTKSARKAKFINILRQFQDLNNYASKMNRTFGVILLVQPLISSFSMILSLFCVMVNFWYAGIGYIIFAYTQLLSMCAVGQSVQNNNGHLLKVLSETEWILFSIEEQKLFVNALRAQQRAPDFWIGPFVPYNMETASKVTQKIYSYAMMLMRITK